MKKLGAKSGDLLFCSSDNFNGSFIRFFTWSKWSHVAIILEIDGDFWVLESTTDDLPLNDYISKKPKSGVQMVDLVEKIAKYRGEIGIRSINRRFSDKLTRGFFKFYQKYQNREFCPSSWEMIKSWYDGPFGRNKQQTKTFFCAQLIAEGFKQRRMAVKGKPSSEYTQKSFETFQPIKNTKYGPRYRYDDEICYVKKFKYNNNIGVGIGADIGHSITGIQLPNLNKKGRSLFEEKEEKEYFDIELPGNLVMDILKYI